MTPATEPDVPRLLGLTGPGAWAMVALFWATYLILIAFSGGPPMRTVEGWIAFVATLVAAVVVVLPGRYPLRLGIVLAVLGVVAFATVAVSWHLEPTGWPGWTSWNFGSNTFLLFMLALRGRVWWGAAGILLMIALTVHWTWATTGDVWHGIDLTYRQLATYSAGAFFAIWLRRTARQIVEYQAAEQRRIRDEQGRESADGERDRQLDRLRRLAGPALEVIARAAATEAERRGHELLEAQLRDGIRGRSLADDGPLTDAVRAARMRGARVALLDDLPAAAADALRDDDLTAARAWAAEKLATLDAGEVTVRLALADGLPVVTVASGDHDAVAFSPSPAPRAAGPRAARDPRA